MNIETSSALQGAVAARRAWLSSLIMRRDGRLLPRLALAYEQLRALPRPLRRRLQRRLAVTLAGAALLLALGRAPAMSDTIQVFPGETEFSNNGRCSIREAIVNANNTSAQSMIPDCAAGNPGGADTIVLPSGSRFSLFKHLGPMYGSDTALPLITSPITIEGHGAIIERPPSVSTPFRLLAVAPLGELRLVDINLEGGAVFGVSAAGGAVRNHGALTLDGGALRRNSATSGGGIANFGILTIDGATLEGNVADSGGAILNVGSGNPDDLDGGSVTLMNSLLSGNEADSGGALTSYYGLVTISGTTFDHNTATIVGGGAFVYGVDEKPVTIDSSTFTSNTVVNGSGGGLFARWGTVDIRGSTFNGNTAANGKGGGMLAGARTVNLHSSTLSGNKAAYGGGLYNEMADMTITNSTVSGNEANYGGGLFNWAADLTIYNSTFTANDAYYTGGGIQSVNAVSNLILARSLISGNTAGGDGREVYNSLGLVFAGDYNLFGFNNDAGVSGFYPGLHDIVPPSGVALSAILNPIPAANGGATLTHALPTGSPAVDAARNTSCTFAPVSGLDQRGLPRNADGDGELSTRECDIGAYELQPINTGHALFVPAVVID